MNQAKAFQFYLEISTSDLERNKLSQQDIDIKYCNLLQCYCNNRHPLDQMYRCLYCGVYFCFKCAEEHFGQTVEEWVENRDDETKKRQIRKTENTTRDS